MSASFVVVDAASAQRQLTLIEFVSQRYSHISRDEWLQRFASGKVHDAQAVALSADALCTAQQKIFYYRSVTHEVPVPFAAQIRYANEHIVIADKPHFLPVTPTGRYVKETLLARLKLLLGNEALVPVHRIDRDTAGLVMFSLRPETRGTYQALFRERRVKKTYEAIAPFSAAHRFPLQYESRLEPAAHFMQMREVQGPPNAFTEIALRQRRGELACYTLMPLTGKRHQLRVQMAALGIPICHDGLYPVLTPERAADDFTKPLLLLAKALVFDDPVTHQRVAVESGFSLSWPDADIDADAVTNAATNANAATQAVILSAAKDPSC